MIKNTIRLGKWCLLGTEISSQLQTISRSDLMDGASHQSDAPGQEQVSLPIDRAVSAFITKVCVIRLFINQQVVFGISGDSELPLMSATNPVQLAQVLDTIQTNINLLRLVHYGS